MFASSMFTYVWDVKIGYVICGIIWSLACGFSVGNYACSLVHRLPRGRLVLDKPPYCGTCGTLLATRDLFPVFSALWLRHKCRYCHTPYPVSHTWTELLVGLLFVLAYFKYGYNETFFLVSFIGVFLIILAAIETNERIVMGKILVCLVVCGMVYRTLMDASIYGFLEGGLYGLILGAVLWNKQVKKVGHIYVLPPYAQLMAVGGLIAGDKAFPMYFALLVLFSAVFYALTLIRRKPFTATVPFGLALTLMVLYPAMFEGLIPPLHF